MLLHIPSVFSQEDVATIRAALEQAEWADGKATAGYQSAKAKHNLQLAEDHPLARQIGEAMLQRLWSNPLFMSAALPHKVFPPLFNCYTGGGNFDFHIDNAIRQVRNSAERVRTDICSTRRPACTRSSPSPVAAAWRHFSGPKVWFATTASAACYLIWTKRSSN